MRGKNGSAEAATPTEPLTETSAEPPQQAPARRGVLSLFGGGRDGATSEKGREAHPELTAAIGAGVARYPTTRYQYCLGPGDEIGVLFYRKPPVLDVYRVNCLDVLTIVVEGERSVRETVTVRTDGMISFHQVDDQPVKGKTIAEVRDMLRAAYTKLAPSAAITVILERGQVLAEQFLKEVNHYESAYSITTVRPDGIVSLPLVGDINVVGMSIARVREVVEEQLDAKLAGVVGVNFNLIALKGNTAVLGEVQRPGMYPVYEPMHPMYAVALAGGKLDSANIKKVVVLKKTPNGYLAPFSINLDPKYIARVAGDTDVMVEPEDIVVVPKSGVANVNLWIEQYIRRMLPVPGGMNATYTINQ